MMYDKKILGRARNLFKNPNITEAQMFRLASSMNEYIDFVEVVKTVGADDNMLKIERMLSQNISNFCDEIEKEPVRRLSLR